MQATELSEEVTAPLQKSGVPAPVAHKGAPLRLLLLYRLTRSETAIGFILLWVQLSIH